MATAAKALKVGLVLDSGLDKPDGVQQYVLAIGGWLETQGHEVHYLVGQTKRQDIPRLHSLSRSISVRFNGNNGSVPLMATRRKLRKFLAAEHFDVLHIQVPHHPFLAQRIILEADQRTAIVGTFHIAPYNKLATIATRLLGVWLRPSLRHFDRMVSVSPTAQAFAEKTFHITSDVLPNVIDYGRFHGAQPLPQYDDDVLTILFLGRLVPRKGCQLLLEAIVLLSQNNKVPHFRVVVCGTGPLEGKLRQLVAKHGLEQQVEFVGFVTETDKPRYYASADIAVFPSSGGESFGIVLLEAMASGRAAVLAGDNPGYSSVMAPRQELLFDPHDSSALAEKLTIYLTDTKLRQVAQRWGATYTKEFAVAVVGAKLLKIYRQALHERRGQ